MCFLLVVLGMGFGLMYLPAIVIVGFYFDKKRALATGLAVCGSGIGTMIFAPLSRILLDNYGWKGSYVIIAGIILNGMVCGAVFRPLEATKTTKKQRLKRLAEEDARKSVIMEKIIEEKKRQRTISSGSLDGSYITTDNRLIKDPEKIKQIRIMLLEKLVEETGEDFASEPNIASASSDINKAVVGNGIIPARSCPADSPLADEVQVEAKIAFSPSNHSLNSSSKAINRQVARVQSTEGINRRVRTISNDSDMQSAEHQLLTGSTKSLSDIQKERRKDMARPLYRQDIFFQGSLASLSEFKSTSDMASYTASITSIPLPPEEDSTSCMPSCAPLCVVIKQMLDFSLLRSLTFVLLCSTSVLGMTGRH